MGLGFILSRPDCFGTTESGWTETLSHPAHAPLMVSGSRSTPGTGSSFSLNSASPERNHLPPLPPDTGIKFGCNISRWLAFKIFLIFKWSRTQMVTFLLSQSLEHEPVWAGKLKPIVCFWRNYCTDQFSLNQLHTWQCFPFPAFIWMGGFVPLVLTSPHLMPVSNILPEAQTSSAEIPCHCKQYTCYPR